MAEIPANLAKFVLDPISHGLAATARQALKNGVPAHDVVEMLLNHLASVVAMIEPAGVRANTIENLVENFAGMVRQHVDFRHTSPGGIFVPNGEIQPNG